MIGNNDVVTLEIQEEVSSVISGGVQATTVLSNQMIGPTTKINRTTARVHVPNRYFLILSGMLSEKMNATVPKFPAWDPFLLSVLHLAIKQLKTPNKIS